MVTAGISQSQSSSEWVIHAPTTAIAPALA
jgi:hypothetical protein